MLVCVGIPSIDAKAHARTVDSLLAETLLGARQGVYFLVMWELGNSLIGVARNKLAKRFLDSKADCLIFVDADVSWKGGELARLARRPEDVVGGSYRQKTDDEKFHVRGIPQASGDLLKVEGIPTGFLKLSRKALKTIKAEPYTDGEGREMRNWFPTGVHDRQFWGEDYNFCRLWRESGGEVFLDPTIDIRHHDGLRSYNGNLMEWLDKAVAEARL